MEILFGLVLFGAFIYLLPQIVGGVLMIFAAMFGIVALFFKILQKIFGK